MSRPPSLPPAEPASNNTPAAPPPPSADLNPPNLHSCFICLLNESETPGAKWVNPCPCTLEAHEDCMLRWVAETENNNMSSSGTGRGKKALRCPACNARIRVDEPFDLAVYVRERLHRAYSRTSPLVLVGFVVSGAVVSSASYGVTAAVVFGGREALDWLNIPNRSTEYRGVWQLAKLWIKPTTRVSLLSLVGPVLMIHRALPGLGRVFTLPASLLYGGFLVFTNQMPTWPPSGQWALAAMPCVNLIYSHLYYDLFGDFEKRLNRALKGRPAEEAPANAPAADANAVRAQANRPGAANAAADQAVNEPGWWEVLWQLGNAVVALFEADEEVVIQAQVRVGGGDQDDLLDMEVERGLEELELEIEAEEQAEEGQEALDGQAWPHAEPVVLEVDGLQQNVAEEPPAVVLGDQPAVDPQDPAGPNQGGANNNNEIQNQNGNQIQDQEQRERDDGTLATTLSDIINSASTSLLLPVLSAGMGELLRLTLPAPWVKKPLEFRPGSTTALTGLLQHRWGRSLVGGCLFIVLKDMFFLYAKYRKVTVKKQRKVRNVSSSRRRRATTGTATATATATEAAPTSTTATAAATTGE